MHVFAFSEWTGFNPILICLRKTEEGNVTAVNLTSQRTNINSEGWCRRSPFLLSFFARASIEKREGFTQNCCCFGIWKHSIQVGLRTFYFTSHAKCLIGFVLRFQHRRLLEFWLRRIKTFMLKTYILFISVLLVKSKIHYCNQIVVNNMKY